MNTLHTRTDAAPRLLDTERAVEAARALVAESPADETEVTIDACTERFVRYADTGPTQSADRERVVVHVRARLAASTGWQEARAECDGLGKDEMRAALARALELARSSPPDTELTALGGPVEVARTQADENALAHPFEEKAEWVRSALGACSKHDLQPAGLATTSAHARVLVSSAGREVTGARSRAAFSLTATADNGRGGSGFAQSIARRPAELDVAATIERAVSKAVLNRAPEPFEAGEYPVVLEPAAVSAILLFAAYQGFGAQEVAEQASFLCGRVGTRGFPESLSVHDDAANDVYPGYLFDGEGTPRTRVALIDRGVLGEPVTDRRWAARTGRANTGHAQPQPTADGPRADDLVVAAGDKTLDELIGGLERGLLVTQFHYPNLIDPRTLLLTGMTRNGTFLVEHGRIVRAVRNLRFTDSLVRAFAGIRAIGRDREVAGALFDGEIVCPAIALDSFRFTSTTDF